MSKFKSFFKNKVKPIEAVKVKLDRFEDEIELLPLTPEQQEQVMDASKKRRPGMKGKTEEVISEGRYVRLRLVKSIVFPDLEDTELQKDYGVVGSEALLNELFTADELSEMLSSLDAKHEVESLQTLTEEAKN